MPKINLNYLFSFLVLTQVTFIAFALNSYMTELSAHSNESLRRQLEREISNADFFSLSNRLETWSKLENIECVNIFRAGNLLYSSTDGRCRTNPWAWSFMINIPAYNNSYIFVRLMPSVKAIIILVSIFLANVLTILIWIKANKDHFRQLDAKERAWLKAARQAAHDIKSPLSALKMIGDIVVMNQNHRDLLDTANKKVEAIANELLSKTRNDQMVGLLSAGEVSALISNVVETPLNDQKTARVFESGVLDFSGHIYANKFDLERILQNLIRNSIEAKQKNLITIEIKKFVSENFLFISVRDDGIGIAPEMLSLLHKNSVSTKKSGFGLGLSNARETLDLWGGKFSVTSQLGEGTTVNLGLRIAPDS